MTKLHDVAGRRTKVGDAFFLAAILVFALAAGVASLAAAGGQL